MKYLLLPFSWLYGFLTYCRNTLYDRGFLKTYKSSLKTIIIGNLQVGGSGKTPMTAYLYELFCGRYKTSILLRGYGRKTKGLIEANDASDTISIGDEAVWYKKHLKDSRVIVSESREAGLKYLEKTDTQLVLLDDALQHRSVTADITMLLSDYSMPYYEDYPMPFGRMREYRTGDKRADIIIITKCPKDLNLEKKIDIIKKVNPLDHQTVFFTSLEIGQPYPLKGDGKLEDASYKQIVALSAIANPDSFESGCRQFCNDVKSRRFRDHHAYSKRDVDELNVELTGDSIVMTTEKDAVKLLEKGLFEMIEEDRYYVLPVRPFFLFDEEKKFKQSIRF